MGHEKSLARCGRDRRIEPARNNDAAPTMRPSALVARPPFDEPGPVELAQRQRRPQLQHAIGCKPDWPAAKPDVIERHQVAARQEENLVAIPDRQEGQARSVAAYDMIPHAFRKCAAIASILPSGL